MRCEDCGTIMSGNLCPNCDEEAFIFENQIDDYPNDFKFSEDFNSKVQDQFDKREEREYNNVV